MARSITIAASPSPTKGKARSPTEAADGSPGIRNGPVHRKQARLLWRGSLVLQDGSTLHGIALVIHLASETSTVPSRPSFLRSLSSSGPPIASTSSSGPSAADDVFSAPPSVNPFLASAADICLDLEMTRHRPLKVVTNVTIGEQAASATKKPRKATKNAVGRYEETLPVAEVDVEADVRVYVDPRCPSTSHYFEQSFCSTPLRSDSSRTSLGMAIALAEGQEPSQQLVIFGERVMPSTDTVLGDSDGLTELRLMVGRRKVIRKAVPRPDDPAPREPMLLDRFRKSMSHPNLFAKPTAPIKRAVSGPDLRTAMSKAPNRPTARNPLGTTAGKRKAGGGTPGRRGEKRPRKDHQPSVHERSPSEMSFVGTTVNGGSPTPSLAGSQVTMTAWEKKNKDTVKKIVYRALEARGITKSSSEFKDLYGVTLKGVNFALAVDRDRAKEVTDAHLAMYIVKPVDEMSVD